MKFLALLLLASSLSALASVPKAYRIVSKESGVPQSILFSVAMEESRRYPYGLPWPWTLNVDHKAYYFESRSEAAEFLNTSLNNGSAVAVGLSQIYLPAHGHLFDDPEVLLSPETNLLYASNLLAGEFIWTKRNAKASWWHAVARYHHPSNYELGKAYALRVFKHCTSFASDCDKLGALP